MERPAANDLLEHLGALGGAIALVFIFLFDYLTVDYFRAQFADGGYLICTSICDGLQP